jgi:3-deoxy-D-manno-octulosonate 8-phosphate phosphatase (KDO 8-P phosphatase)
MPKQKSISVDIKLLIKNIRLLVLDVDGVLTTGALWFTDKGEEIKVFNIYDGFGIKVLLQHGIEVAVISGRKSEAVNKRMAELGVKYVYQGIDYKLPILDELIKELRINYEQVAYIGDDLPDLPLIDTVGFGIAVNNAQPKVLQHAKLVTKTCGGMGAVREVCDLLLATKSEK